MTIAATLLILGALSGSSQRPFDAGCRAERFATLEPELSSLAKRLLSRDYAAFSAVEPLGPTAAPIGVAVLCATEGCCDHPNPLAYEERDEWVNGIGAEAVAALVALGPSVLPELAKLVVKTQDNSVREAFARACDALDEGVAPAASALLTLVNDGIVSSVGRGAVGPSISALQKIGPESLAPMVAVTRKAVEKPGSNPTFGIQHLLGYWRNPPGRLAAVVPLLTRMLTRTSFSPSLLEANAQALQSQGHLAASSLGALENIRNRDARPEVRDSLDRAIASIKQSKAEHDAGVNRPTTR